MKGLVQKKELSLRDRLVHMSILVHKGLYLTDHRKGLWIRDKLVHLTIMVHKKGLCLRNRLVHMSIIVQKGLYLRDRMVNLSIMDHKKGLCLRDRLVHLSTMVHRLYLKVRLVHLSRLNTTWSLSNHFHLKNDTVVLKQKMFIHQKPVLEIRRADYLDISIIRILHTLTTHVAAETPVILFTVVQVASLLGELCPIPLVDQPAK